MSKRPGANKENLEETRRIFLDVAREEFAEHGYAAASTSRIVEKSGMARGSLYYHFGDKEGLFFAVYEEAMVNAHAQIKTAMDKEADPWAALLKGANMFLDMCMTHDFRKITLIESQAAIKVENRFEVLKRTLIAQLKTITPGLLKQGYFQGHTENTLVVFVVGVLSEIGRSFDFSEDINKDRASYASAFEKSFALRA